MFLTAFMINEEVLKDDDDGQEVPNEGVSEAQEEIDNEAVCKPRIDDVCDRMFDTDVRPTRSRVKCSLKLVRIFLITLKYGQ